MLGSQCVLAWMLRISIFGPSAKDQLIDYAIDLYSAAFTDYIVNSVSYQKKKIKLHSYDCWGYFHSSDGVLPLKTPFLQRATKITVKTWERWGK